MPNTAATTVRARLTKFQEAGRDVARDMASKRLTVEELAGVPSRDFTSVRFLTPSGWEISPEG